MPLVMDPVTGKYVAKARATPAAAAASSETGAASDAVAEGTLLGLEVGATKQQRAAQQAELEKANKLMELLRQRAEAAEAKAVKLEEQQRLVASNATKGMESALAAKAEEIVELERRLAQSQAETVLALEDTPVQVAVAVAEAERATAAPLHKELASAHDATAKLATKLEETRAANDDLVAEMKANAARELAKVTSEQTQEIAELVAALNRRERLGKAKAGEGKSTKAARAAANKVVEKAQAQVESWEIANIGNKQIELVHQILEMLERLTDLADTEVAKQRQPGLVKVQASAHFVLKDLEASRDQLYAQLYSQDNLLGHHYLKNYPVNSKRPEVTEAAETSSKVGTSDSPSQPSKSDKRKTAKGSSSNIQQQAKSSAPAAAPPTVAAKAVAPTKAAAPAAARMVAPPTAAAKAVAPMKAAAPASASALPSHSVGDGSVVC